MISILISTVNKISIYVVLLAIPSPYGSVVPVLNPLVVLVNFHICASFRLSVFVSSLISRAMLKALYARRRFDSKNC